MAHIVPAREEAWFDSNSMGNYTMDVNAKASVGDGANMMLLRADVHSLYDKDKWTIVPKDTSLVFHLLSPSLELSRLYHNVPLQDNLNGVSMGVPVGRVRTCYLPVVGAIPTEWCPQMAHCS